MLGERFGMRLQTFAVGAFLECRIEHLFFPLRVGDQVGFDLVEQFDALLDRTVGGALQFVEEGAEDVMLILERLENVACHVGVSIAIEGGEHRSRSAVTGS